VREGKTYLDVLVVATVHRKLIIAMIQTLAMMLLNVIVASLKLTTVVEVITVTLTTNAVYAKETATRTVIVKAI
jgi:hypothetical protein